MRIVLHRGKSLSIVDAKRFFFDCIIAVPFVFKRDISKSQFYFDAQSAMSGLFSYTGISFAISKRLLAYAHKSVQDETATVSLHYFRLLQTIHDCLIGNWDREFDIHTVDHAIKIGDLNAAALHLIYLNIMYSEKGDFETCDKIIDKLKNIIDHFDHDYALFCFFRMNSRYLIQKRELSHVLKTTDDAIELGNKIGVEMQGLTVVGMKLKAQVMLNELDTARQTIETGEEVIHNVDRVPPIFFSSFLIGKFLYDMAMLEKALAQNQKDKIAELRKATRISAQKALANSKALAESRIEVYRLMGKYCWLEKKERKAFKWWSKSINESKRLGARPELARTYLDVARGLSAPGSNNKELNGIGATGYLNKARSIFTELKLQWDLDELDRVSGAH